MEGWRKDLIISSHARERWIERVADPERYSHFRLCKKGCEQCISLQNDIKNVISAAKRHIDNRIYEVYKAAKDANNIITDISFVEAIKKEQKNDNLKFYQSLSRKAIFVSTPDRFSPDTVDFLVTVLSGDMLEGTIFRNLDKEEVKNVFKRWKSEAKKAVYK